MGAIIDGCAHIHLGIRMTIKRLLNVSLFVSVFIIGIGSLANSATLTIVSWGGAYEKSQVEGAHKPFMAQTDHKLISESYNGGIAELTAQVESGNVSWDVVDLTFSDTIRACDAGLLEPIDPSILPLGSDGSSANDDFLADTLQECGIGSMIGSRVFVYDKSKMGSNPPSTMKDFFDTSKFPGKRGMHKGVETSLEFALIADGVAAVDVYNVLRSSGGIDRAFAKLDTIKDDILWWESGAQPPQMLADGEVIMTTAYNGRIFNAIADEGKPFEIVWDGQIYDPDFWVIPRGSKNMEAALEFIKYATGSEALARQTSYISYGPVRKSSIAKIGKYHKNENIDMVDHMPTSPKNLVNSVKSDFEFWADNREQLDERFNAWLSN